MFGVIACLMRFDGDELKAFAQDFKTRFLRARNKSRRRVVEMDTPHEASYASRQFVSSITAGDKT